MTPTRVIRHHDVAEHLPRRAADTVGGLLQHRRHGVEHVARYRGDEGQHHDGEDQTGSQNADPVRRSGEQSRENRKVSKRVDQKRLQGLLQERRENEQAPDAIDDARNAGQQLDGDADGAPQQWRTKLRQEKRDQQSDRDRDQHGDERRDDRTVDRRQRAEPLGDRVPALLEQEAQAKGFPSRHRADHQGNNDRAEEDEDAGGRCASQIVEDAVRASQAAEHLGPRGDNLDTGGLLPQRHIDHVMPPLRLHLGPSRKLACIRANEAASRPRDKGLCRLDTTKRRQMAPLPSSMRPISGCRGAFRSRP